jgi:hypothetical protein
VKKDDNFKNGPIELEIIGDTTHLFTDEDFEKKEVQLLYNNEEEATELVDSSNNNNSNYFNHLLTIGSKKKNQTHLPCKTSKFIDNLSTVNETNYIQMVNGSRLTQILTNSDKDNCFLVLFYVPWCPFSVKLAPIYNSLPRLFSNLDILAFDVSKSIGYNTKFGTSAVPIILLFQHKNVLSKFNYTQKSLTSYIDFISNHTGFNCTNKTIEFITDDDLIGPVPTVVETSYDYLLLFSWLFLTWLIIDYLINRPIFQMNCIKLIKWLIQLTKRPLRLPPPIVRPMIQQQHQHND